MKRSSLLMVGASAAVFVAFLFGLTFGFVVLSLLTIVTFLEFERRETEIKEIVDYVNMKVVSKFKNHSFSIGVVFTIIGMSLLSPAFLIKEGWAYWYVWQKEISRILQALQLPFFLIAIMFLAVGLILTNRDLK